MPWSARAGAPPSADGPRHDHPLLAAPLTLLHCWRRDACEKRAGCRPMQRRRAAERCDLTRRTAHFAETSGSAHGREKVEAAFFAVTSKAIAVLGSAGRSIDGARDLAAGTAPAQYREASRAGTCQAFVPAENRLRCRRHSRASSIVGKKSRANSARLIGKKGTVRLGAGRPVLRNRQEPPSPRPRNRATRARHSRRACSAGARLARWRW